MAQAELSDFLLTLSIGLLGALVICVPAIVWRLIRRRPIVQRGRSLNSPGVFYAGIAIFGELTIMSFVMHRPLNEDQGGGRGWNVFLSVGGGHREAV